MRAVRLIVEPFEFLSLQKVESIKELNKHGEIQITGLIEFEKSQQYMKKASVETWVSVKIITENDEVKQFFNGILTGLQLKQEGQSCVLTIEIKTGSMLLDIKPHIRSFQDLALTYSDVLHSCLNSSGGKAIMLDKKNISINRLLIQYNETDWDFIKRLSTYAGTIIIPEDATPGKKIYFGFRTTTGVELLNPDSYQMEQGYEVYEKKKVAGVGVELSDMVSYKVRTREIYSLGDNVIFQGKVFVIKKIISWLEGQELYNEYNLVTQCGGLSPVTYNDRLSGISLKANVTAVERTKVQIRIQEDENKDHCKAQWFDYATIYSTPDGTGWYCMPEIGDEVRLLVPDREEKHAYVVGSMHVGMSNGRIDPEKKSWKNRQNKEVLLTPDSIVFQNNKGLLIELSDQEGIKIVSNKNISVQSEGDIEIRSKAGTNISANSYLLMRQGGASIHMTDEINIGGGKIYMN